MKQTIFALALLVAFGAHAQSNSVSGSTSTSNPNVTSGNSGAESSSTSVSNPYNGASQAVQINTYTPDTQRVISNSSSSATSNQTYSGTQRNINEGTTTQNINYSGTQTVKNVPGIAMSGPASGPCTGASGGLGVAGPGFGVGLNGSKVDDGCTVRENTRTLGQVYQALDSADPLKAQAREAMVAGMAILANMNAKIGGDYAPPQAAPKTAQVAAPAPVAATPVQPQAAAPASTNAKPQAVAYTGNDPYVKARLGIK